MSDFLDNLKNSLDKGEFNSEAAKKILEVDKKADNAKGLTEEDQKKLKELIAKEAVSPEEAAKHNTEYETKMKALKEIDGVNAQLANLIDIEDMVQASINDMMSFIKELETQFEKQIEEKNIIYNDLSLKIEEVKTKYVSIVKPLN